MILLIFETERISGYLTILYLQDDWDSDFDEESSQAGGSVGPQVAGQFLQPAASQQIMASTGDVSTSGRKISAATTKSSFNRFSVFVKTGSENFMLGKVNTSVPEQDVLTIVVRKRESRWWRPAVNNL